MTQQSTVAGRKTILIVEDDPEIRELESFLLGAEGYAVVGLADGELAAKTAAEVHADVVLLDLMLPGKHGNQVLQELGADASTRGVPVIVVSAFPRQLQRTEQVKVVLSKPFDVTELLDSVGVAVAGSGS